VSAAPAEQNRHQEARLPNRHGPATTLFSARVASRENIAVCFP